MSTAMPDVRVALGTLPYVPSRVCRVSDVRPHWVCRWLGPGRGTAARHHAAAPPSTR